MISWAEAAHPENYRYHHLIHFLQKCLQFTKWMQFRKLLTIPNWDTTTRFISFSTTNSRSRRNIYFTHRTINRMRRVTTIGGNKHCKCDLEVNWCCFHC